MLVVVQLSLVTPKLLVALTRYYVDDGGQFDEYKNFKTDFQGSEERKKEIFNNKMFNLFLNYVS